MCTGAKILRKKKLNRFQKQRRKLRFHEGVVVTYRRNYGAALNVVILYFLLVKDSVKEFLDLYHIFTFLFAKSQAGNTLIRELLCVFPLGYKFCLPQRVICIKRLNNFTL